MNYEYGKLLADQTNGLHNTEYSAKNSFFWSKDSQSTFGSTSHLEFKWKKCHLYSFSCLIYVVVVLIIAISQDYSWDQMEKLKVVGKWCLSFLLTLWELVFKIWYSCFKDKQAFFLCYTAFFAWLKLPLTMKKWPDKGIEPNNFYCKNTGLWCNHWQRVVVSIIQGKLQRSVLEILLSDVQYVIFSCCYAFNPL